MITARMSLKVGIKPFAGRQANIDRDPIDTDLKERKQIIGYQNRRGLEGIQQPSQTIYS